jgi:hypothetical protein
MSTSAPYLGIHLDATRAWAATTASGNEPPAHVRLGLVPPAVFSLQGLSLNDEIEGVEDFPSIRSTGGAWREKACSIAELRAQRVTLLDAWRDLSRGVSGTAPLPHIDRRSAAEAIALIAGGVAEKTGFYEGGLKAGLAIPNHLDESGQDALLTALSPLGSTVDRLRLIWRPIASAISWCQQHGLSQPKSAPGQSIGGLLCIHLGIDSEMVCVQLVPTKFQNQQFLLPARDRPGPRDVAPSPPAGEHLLEDLIMEALPSAIARNKDAHWRLAWTTPWLNSLLGNGDGGPSSVHDDLLARLATGATAKTGLREVCGGLELGQQVQTWVRTFRSVMGEPKKPWRGAVVSGPFAGIPLGRTTLGEHIARTLLGGTSQPVMVADPTRNFDPTSHGAAVFAARADSGWPTYLDTLPKLELLVIRKGEPEWLDVLRDLESSDDTPQYVDGNREWERDPNLEGVALPINERRPRFDLMQQGHSTARRAVALLPKAPNKKQPVYLNIRMRPASGFARIRVLPADADFTFERPVLLDFQSMEDTGKTRERVLAEVERGWPAIHRRKASPDAWREFVHLTLSSAAVSTRLSDFRKALVRKDNAYDKGATALSSEGAPPPMAVDGEKLLLAFLDRVTPLITRPSVASDAEAVLGYTSAEHPTIRDLLDKRLRGTELSQESLILIGNCAREPRVIARALTKIQAELEAERPPAFRAVAVAQLCRFRESALEATPTNVCNGLAECLDRLIAEKYSEASQYWQDYHRPKSLAIIFRECCRAVLFLLRRRKYDENFLPPDGVTARSLKETFRKTTDAVQADKMRFMAGAVSQLDTLHQISLYIDWKGSGVVNFGDDD